MLPTITNDEIIQTLGINLETELMNDDEPSSKVKRFIKNTSEWCHDFLRRKYGLNDDISTLPSWRQNYFKQGVIKQIEYILQNGKLSVDSGYIRETALVIDLSNISISPDAYAKFYLGAFCNIRNEYYAS